jgi:pantothenate kinase
MEVVTIGLHYLWNLFVVLSIFVITIFATCPFPLLLLACLKMIFNCPFECDLAEDDESGGEEYHANAKIMKITKSSDNESDVHLNELRGAAFDESTMRLMKDSVDINPYVVGVCGCTGAGKTHICRKIIDRINKVFGPSSQNVVLISQDWYYYNGNSETNFDIPSAIDFDLMSKQTKDLINGSEISCPIYDFATHSRIPDRTQQVLPAKIIILEGILIFTQEQIRNLCDLKVFVDSS